MVLDFTCDQPNDEWIAAGGQCFWGGDSLQTRWEVLGLEKDSQAVLQHWKVEGAAESSGGRWKCRAVLWTCGVPSWNCFGHGAA